MRWNAPLCCTATSNLWQVIVDGEPAVRYFHSPLGLIEAEASEDGQLADGWYLARSWMGDHIDFAGDTISTLPSAC